jgi:glycopeptide antibiotics resistance protein
LKEILYNVIVFVPLGVYVEIFREEWKIATKCSVAFVTSLLFEVVQFIFAIGASDVTDIIGNTFGGIVGILFCIVMKKIAPKKFLSIINITGIFIETVAIGLMVLLLCANR